MSDRKEISRRRFLQAGAGLAAVSWAGSNAFGAERELARRPNLLYVISDMHRAVAMGCYGNPDVHTPVLDAFSRQGARFDACISNSPVCAPHRASLTTGLYSFHHGVVTDGVPLRPGLSGITEQFQGAGYVTGMASGHSEERESVHGGYPRDVVDAHNIKKTHGHYVMATVRDKDGREVEKEFYKPTLQADGAIRFIQEKSKGKAPWMLFLPWQPPHMPYMAPPEFRKHYEGKLQLRPNVPPGLPAKFATDTLPDYYGLVESLDTEFKRVLDALDRAGVAQDTIVCYSTDHGDMLGSHGYIGKRWPHEESVRIPFLIRYPRRIPAGQVIAPPFSSVDMYPTLAALAGLKPPAGLDGLDYSPLLTGRATKPPRDYVFMQMAYAYVPWPGWRGLRTEQYTYARTLREPWVLYDLHKDPYQLNNLVNDAASRSLVAEMDKRLTALMKETGDSWDVRATEGDMDLWIVGGKKQQDQNLGVPYPGSPTPEQLIPGARQMTKKKRANAP